MGASGESVRFEIGPELGARMALAIPIVAVILVLTLLKGLQVPWMAPWLLLFDIGIGGLLVADYKSTRNLRLFVDPDGAGWVDRLGRTHRLPKGTSAERSCVPGFRYGPQPYLAFFGPDGRMLFRTMADLWGIERLEDFCQRAGISPTGSYDVVSPSESNPPPI
jgi:hypothetical protein